MGILNKLTRRKKTEEKTPEKVEDVTTELEKFLANDKETYKALQRSMILDPREVEASMKEAVEKAKELEKQRDTLRARMWYEVAGGLAIYEGDVKKVKEYFSKCTKLSPNIEYPILENTERAVQKAQEYYKKYLE
ncbi:MAG: hypothetical protein OEX77_03025 [Candidatus Bathyarchaeota archaeon]|nr:hypothetical protein [Candidatus Bathyarchaeota archaeon]MDH5732527.1 hypothetical protein [Candidatus Bathyarchaeota archaeon]